MTHWRHRSLVKSCLAYARVCTCTHTIQTLRDAARTRTLHVDTEHSLQADTDHTQASYLNPQDTGRPHRCVLTYTHTRTHLCGAHPPKTHHTPTFNTQPSTVIFTSIAKAYRIHLTQPAHVLDGHTFISLTVYAYTSYRPGLFTCHQHR